MLQILPAKCAFAILGYLFLAFSRYGLPCVIRTDNEAMFTSRVWRQTLRALGILLRRCPPCQPWHNGRIERLFGTLKQSLRRLQLGTACALQAALDEFNIFYNQVRPHQALAGLTPQEAWQGQTLAEVQEAYCRGRWRVGASAGRAFDWLSLAALKTPTRQVLQLAFQWCPHSGGMRSFKRPKLPNK